MRMEKEREVNLGRKQRPVVIWGRIRRRLSEGWNLCFLQIYFWQLPHGFICHSSNFRRNHEVCSPPEWRVLKFQRVSRLLHSEGSVITQTHFHLWQSIWCLLFLTRQAHHYDSILAGWRFRLLRQHLGCGCERGERRYRNKSGPENLQNQTVWVPFPPEAVRSAYSIK